MVHTAQSERPGPQPSPAETALTLVEVEVRGRTAAAPMPPRQHVLTPPLTNAGELGTVASPSWASTSLGPLPSQPHGVFRIQGALGVAGPWHLSTVATAVHAARILTAEHHTVERQASSVTDLASWCSSATRWLGPRGHLE